MTMRGMLGIGTAGMMVFSGCSSLPGNDEQQGAVIGGASGAAVGAAVSKNRALGAVIGGAVGAAGGYVIGKNKDKIIGSKNGENAEAAQEAARQSQTSPATVQDVRATTTADLNSDGFVTLDEMVAMKQAGLSDVEMLQRLRATNQVFNLTAEQKQFLLDHGVSAEVVNQLPTINQDQPAPVISRPGV